MSVLYPLLPQMQRKTFYLKLKLKSSPKKGHQRAIFNCQMHFKSVRIVKPEVMIFLSHDTTPANLTIIGEGTYAVLSPKHSTPSNIEWIGLTPHKSGMA
jgi:hypothetical protein